MGNQSLHSLALESGRYTPIPIYVLSELAAAHLLPVCEAADLHALTVHFRENFVRKSSSTCKPFRLSRDRTPEDKAEQTLWQTLLKGFGQTSHLEDNECFLAVANSVLHSLLNEQGIRPFLKGVYYSIEQFTQTLSALIRQKSLQHHTFNRGHGSATACVWRSFEADLSILP